MKNINWYPGHMKKTRELIQNSIKMVDVVIEVIDARIPVSSRNPIINQLVEGKPRVIIKKTCPIQIKIKNGLKNLQAKAIMLLSLTL